MRIIVGTENADKITGTKEAFESMLRENIDLIGVSIPSNVPNQPRTDEENRAGAYNRSNNLFCKYPGYDYYVGIESGLKPSLKYPELFIMRDWACIININGQVSEGSSGGIYLPQPVCELITKGLSLSKAMRQVFPDYNDVGGTLAYLTRGARGRKKEAYLVVQNALTPFLHPKHYSGYLKISR